MCLEQGFSDLMGRSPYLMMPALLIHNNLVTKAKHTNFGYVVEQEGDSYSIAFEEAVDAVRFCLQTQILLSKQTWPEGLFSDPSSNSLSAAEVKYVESGAGPSFTRKLVSTVRRRFQGFTSFQSSKGEQQTDPSFATDLSATEASTRFSPFGLNNVQEDAAAPSQISMAETGSGGSTAFQSEGAPPPSLRVSDSNKIRRAFSTAIDAGNNAQEEGPHPISGLRVRSIYHYYSI
jgi:hypothetical protein